MILDVVWRVHDVLELGGTVLLDGPGWQVAAHGAARGLRGVLMDVASFSLGLTARGLG